MLLAGARPQKPKLIAMHLVSAQARSCRSGLRSLGRGGRGGRGRGQVCEKSQFSTWCLGSDLLGDVDVRLAFTVRDWDVLGRDEGITFGTVADECSDLIVSCLPSVQCDRNHN